MERMHHHGVRVDDNLRALGRVLRDHDQLPGPKHVLGRRVGRVNGLAGLEGVHDPPERGVPLERLI